MALVSERIAKATLERLNTYDSIRGVTPTIPFWDVVVLIAADPEQRESFQHQLTDKVKRKGLPLNTNYLVVNDINETDLGGSLLHILSELSTLYGEKLSRMKLLVIPAGGHSKRLPIASLLGKIFTALPLGNPMYDMLDAKLASLIEFPARMESGIFITSADSVELFAGGSDDWRFPLSGITAQGHPTPIHIGTMHGVFVLAHQLIECNERVEVVESLKVLQKKSKEELKGACLHPSFARIHGVKDDMVLVDSGFLVNYETVSKLVDFYRLETPLQSAIDSQMIFQVLGSQATISTSSSDVLDQDKASGLYREMTLKVSNLLQDTTLNVLVQSQSRFFHIGTSCEYIEHLCRRSDLGLMLGFKRETFNKKTLPDEDTLNQSNGSVRACVMHSILPEQFDWSHPCIVEYCDIQGSICIHDNTIVSNCCIRTTDEGGLRVISSNSVIQTACIKGNRKYATFVFDVRDNMKQSMSRSEVGNMVFMNKRFVEIFGRDAEEVYDSIFPHMNVCSIWHAKLFRPSSTMETAFDVAMALVDKISTSNASYDFQDCLSMADIMKQRDLSSMLGYRQTLYESIIT